MWEESDMHEAEAPRVMAGKWPTGRTRVLGKGGFQVEPATLLRLFSQQLSPPQYSKRLLLRRSHLALPLNKSKVAEK
jgi:hypothetical protein